MNTDQLIARLAGYPSKVHTLVAPLTEDQLRWRAAEGEWSIKEVLGHLRDSSELLGDRVRRIAQEENPHLPRFDEQQLAVDRNYQDDVTPVMMERLASWRTATVELVRHLDPAGWDRLGNHWEQGAVTLRQTVEGIVSHDLEHLGHIRRLREAQGL